MAQIGGTKEDLNEFYWKFIRDFTEQGEYNLEDLLVEIKDGNFKRNEELEELLFVNPEEKIDTVWNKYYKPIVEGDGREGGVENELIQIDNSKCLVTVMKERNDKIKLLFNHVEPFPTHYFDIINISRVFEELAPRSIIIYESFLFMYPRGMYMLMTHALKNGWDVGDRYKEYFYRDNNREIQYQVTKKTHQKMYRILKENDLLVEAMDVEKKN